MGRIGQKEAAKSEAALAGSSESESDEDDFETRVKKRVGRKWLGEHADIAYFRDELIAEAKELAERK